MPRLHPLLTPGIHLIITVILLVLTSSSSAQSTALQKYNEATKRLRTAIKETKRTGALYYHSRAAESDQWREQWQKAGDEGVKAAQDIKDAAIEIMMNSNDPEEQVLAVGFQVCQESRRDGQYGKAYQVAKRLVELEQKDEEIVVEKARAALMTNHFDEVKVFSTEYADLLTDITENEDYLLRQIDNLKASYDRELETRAREAEADDLPRVEIDTTRGKIVIELFENEAPQTVANFISLVESGFYDGIVFHQVERGFMAQAGGFNRKGPQHVGYNIYDEHENEGARKHFRGSVSMASQAPIPNSASSQFFIMALPEPGIDEHHTVFGRVITGMDVVDSLTPTLTRDKEGKEQWIEEVNHDMINSARVLRKRDHDYKTIRVTE